MLIGVAIAAVLLLLVMITYFKINPFVTLMIVSVFLGVAAGMPFDKVLASIQAGLGNTLGFIAIVLGLGTMLGKMLEESGGAERIAKTLINLFGLKKVHWAMMIVAFIVGIPVFFQVGVVLLIPLVFTIAKETGISLLKVGLPLVAGLSIVHGLVPPHPAAMAAVDIFKADVGKTILYSLIVGLPAAALAGPLFASFISKRMRVVGVPEGFADQIKAGREDHEMPGFGITVFTILLPVILMLFATIADLTMDRTSQMFAILKFIGSPFMALLIALLFAFYSFGFNRNFNLTQIGRFCDQSLPAMASILMVIGGGGAFNKVLLDSGIGNEIAKMASTMGLSPIMLAWTIAAMIRIATGSSTVSMMTAAGIVAPLVANSTGVSKEIIVLAVGSGALVLSHVNDAGFWIVKEYFGMSVTETLKTWTVLETILSVSSLGFILLLSKVVS
ncbi:GntP family permease [Pelosinus propionicus]|uniref:Gluconate permease GntT n=1 Tax=Pelosinus propionicus DSM 13327 TaxID=1123291 RepID=A0A1I4J916_9FIRM|nr:GntP family permease [Pelosinus propionicus]SFL63040.1 gluconate permease GntT [Pelosinus propionicus DSM 13327]